MILLKPITYQVLPIAIAFGIGYWILVSSELQQEVLKYTGKILGWVLIILAIFSGIFNYYFSGGPAEQNIFIHQGPPMPCMTAPEDGKPMMKGDESNQKVSPNDEDEDEQPEAPEPAKK